MAVEPRRWGVGAIVGLLAGGVALGVAQLAAGIFGGASSPMIAVGGAAIDATPPWLKDFAIREFGANDKRALLIGIGTILAIVAAALGAVSVRRPWAGVIGIVAFGLIGAAASVSRPANGPADAIPSVIGTLAGLVAYVRLRAVAALEPVRWGASSSRPPPSPPTPPEPPGFDRRRFLRTGAVAAGLAAVSGFAGQYLVRRSDASASRSAVRIPTPADVAPPPPAGADLHVPGVGPFLTPNDRFYRVDTALFVPAVDAGSWQLHVHGMVDREMTIDFAAAAGSPPDRARHHPDVRLEPGRRPVHRQRTLDRRAPEGPAGRGRRAVVAPRRSSRARPTGSRSARRPPWRWTAGTRCWRSR